MQLIQLKNKLKGPRLALICVLLFGMLSAVPAEAQVRDMYLKGVALSEQGAYREARVQFEKALAIDEKNPDCIFHLAEACYRSGDVTEALSWLNSLESLEPGRGSYLLATIYASSGDAAEAVRHLETHLRSPYKLPAHRILLDDAFASIEDSPPWKALWSGTWYTEDEEFLQEIRYLTRSGDHLEALERIDSELNARPDWGELHAARGKLLLEMRQYQGATQSYSRAIETGVADPAVYRGRAEAYLLQKKYAQAIGDLEKAYRMEPEQMDLLIEISKACLKAGQFRKAAESMETYLLYYPDNAEAHYQYGQIHLSTGDYFDALDQFNACLRLDTGDPRYYAARGKTYLETETYPYALKDIGMALDLDAKDKDLWYLRGLVRWKLNEREGALGDWEHAARLGSREAVEKLREYNR
jgi:tetratricopeptide (TPR) repeat protein